MSDTRCHYCGCQTIPSETVEAMIWALPEPHCGHEYVAEARRIRKMMRVVDHKTPRSRGGTNTANNRVTACNDCNNRKGVRPYLDFLFQCWHEESLREKALA